MNPIDPERIRAILEEQHSYYGWHEVPIRRDTRWYPWASSLIAGQLAPQMRVLDIGCGNGGMLLELYTNFQSGVGVDIDPDHIRLAEEAQRAQNVQNVEFVQMNFPAESTRLEPGSFDLVFSLRGPLPDSPANIQAALRLLRPEGLVFCEEIGEQHQHEVGEVFNDHAQDHPSQPVAADLKSRLQAQGIDVRLVADLFTRWCYPDVYAWFAYQCNLWTWLGVPLPAADDPRIGRFTERTAAPSGEIAITHHVVWVAGVKTA